MQRGNALSLFKLQDLESDLPVGMYTYDQPKSAELSICS